MNKERAGKMTNSSNSVPPRQDIIQKIAAIVTLQGPLHKLDLWLRRKLRIGVYRLEGQSSRSFFQKKANNSLMYLPLHRRLR
jgi:hypothetical protein